MRSRGPIPFHSVLKPGVIDRLGRSFKVGTIVSILSRTVGVFVYLDKHVPCQTR